ncbi:MAG: DUF177 domain-containing protein [Bacteroidota bacterium]
MMKIQVGGLSEGLHAYRFTVAPADLGLGAEFEEDVSVQATLEKTGNELLLKTTVATGAWWECDRCITRFRQGIGGGYQMYYVWEGNDTARFDPAELQVVSTGLTMIDLSEDVRQTILLAVPLKRVCREQCKGLCPHCGKNLNEGPCDCRDTIADGRWDKLRELQNDTNDDAR